MCCSFLFLDLFVYCWLLLVDLLLLSVVCNNCVVDHCAFIFDGFFKLFLYLQLSMLLSETLLLSLLLLLLPLVDILKQPPNSKHQQTNNGKASKTIS